MRILILTQWFQPEPNFKGVPFARALIDRGHDVQVITGFPNYPGGKLYPGYSVRPLKRETIDGVAVVRVPLFPSHDASPMRRVLNYASFGLSAAILAPIVARRADVVYVYHPPGTIGLAAMALKVIRRMPYVLDVQDLWPDTLSATGMLSNRVVLAIVDAWMRAVYRSASRVVVLSPGFRRVLLERGVPSEKVEVIYNWTEEATDGEEPACTQAPVLDPDCFNIVFAGNAGRAQGLDSVIDAANLLRDRYPHVRIIFVGGGIERPALERRAEHLGLANVRFLPWMTQSEVRVITSKADALLVALRDESLFSITVPGKTQASLAAGRPILMAVRGDAARLVEDADAGITCSPGDPEAVVSAVGHLLHLSEEERAQMGRNGRNYYERELSLPVGVSRFEACFDSVYRETRVT